MPSCCSNKGHGYTVIDKNEFYIPNPGDLFKISEQKKDIIKMPYDAILSSGKVEVSKKDLLDEEGWHAVRNHTIKIHAGYRIKNFKGAKFARTKEEQKINTHTTDTDATDKKISKFYSIFIFSLAFIASLYAQFTGGVAVIAFSAVLMCICPCIILLVDESINTLFYLILYSKYIEYKGDNLLKDLSRVLESKLYSDFTGTLAKSFQDRELRNGVTAKKEENELNLYVHGKKLEKVISGWNGIEKYANATYQQNKRVETEETFMYMANAVNDQNILRQDNCVGLVVKNSPKSIKDIATFVSRKEAIELENFVIELPKIARKAILTKYFCYTLAFIYTVSVIPLTVLGVISPMYACLALCITSAFIISLFKLLSLHNSKQKEITPEQAEKALNLMAYSDKNNKTISPESKKQTDAQKRACNPEKQNPYNALTIFLLAASFALSWLKISALASFFYYSWIPIITICLWKIIKNSYKKIFCFTGGAALTLGAQQIISYYQFDKFYNLISLAIAAIVLIGLYNSTLDMYEIQLSSILILGIANYMKLIKFHIHHLFLMALMITITKSIKSNSSQTGVTALHPEEVPAYRSVLRVESNYCCFQDPACEVTSFPYSQ